MKKSFILHLDSLIILDDLTNEEAGILFKAITQFQKGEEIELPRDIKMAFLPFKNQFLRDQEKYNQFIEKQREKGVKSSESKKKKKQPNPTTVNQTQPLLAESTVVDSGQPNQPVSTKSTHNDSVSDSDNVNKKDSVFKSDQEARMALEENFKNLVMSSAWVETICMAHKINKLQVLQAIEDFKGGCMIREEYKSLKEIKDHFSYWLPKNKDRLFKTNLFTPNRI